jgi:hypothetical protein
MIEPGDDILFDYARAVEAVVTETKNLKATFKVLPTAAREEINVALDMRQECALKELSEGIREYVAAW